MSLTSLENVVDQPSRRAWPRSRPTWSLPTAPDGARIISTRSWAQAMRDLVAAGGDISRDRAHLITCPALLVAGTYDPHCPPDLTRELAALIPKGQVPGSTGRRACGAPVAHRLARGPADQLARQPLRPFTETGTIRADNIETRAVTGRFR